MKRKKNYFIPLALICLIPCFIFGQRYSNSTLQATQSLHLMNIIIFAALALFFFFMAIGTVAENEDIVLSTKLEEFDAWVATHDYTASSTITYKHGCDKAVALADTQSQVLILAQLHAKEPFVAPSVIPFCDILGCSVLEDGAVTGQIGRAIVGGLIGGGAGAVVGASTAKKKVSHYQVVIQMNDIAAPTNTLELIGTEVSTTSDDYKQATTFASQLSATISAIVAQNQSTAKETS